MFNSLKLKLRFFLGLAGGVLLSLALLGVVGATDTEARPLTGELAEPEAISPTGQVTPTTSITGTEAMTPTGDVTETAEMTSPPPVTSAGAISPSGPAIRVEELLEYEVVDSQGETVGEIEDLVIGLDSGRVPYAVVDFESDLFDLEEEFDRAIPLDQLTLAPEAESFTLNAELQAVQNAPTFGFDTLLDRLPAGWDREIGAYWQENSLTAAQPAAITGTGMITEETFIQVSDLLDYEVMNPQGEGLGDIEGLVMGLDSQQVRYAVLASGGFLGLGEELFAIPYRAMVIDPQISRAVLNVAGETLENAPGFDPDNWPDTADPRWDVDTRQFWQTTGVTPLVASPFVRGRTIDEAGIRVSEILSGSMQTTAEGGQRRVTDLVVGLDSGQAKYALLSTGEDQTLTPVPFYAFVPDVQGLTMVTPGADAWLNDAPSFAADEWPAMTDPAWDFELRDYWRGAGLGVAQPVYGAAVPLTPIDEPARRVSELLGADLNLSGPDQAGSATSATIEDLIMGLNSLFVNYAVVSLDQGLVPVYFPVINFEEGEATLQVDSGAMENIPTLDSETWPEQIVTPNWDQMYRNYWVGSGLGIPVDSVEASDLLGRTVINLQDEALGEMEDFVVGLDNGQITHGVIEFGGFLGFDENLAPVPVDELKIDPFRRVMILDIREEALENAARFDLENRPDISNPDWVNDFEAWWEETLSPTPEQSGDSSPQASIWVSDLLDYSTQNLDGEALGEIEDAVMNFPEKRLEYLVIEVGDFLGIGGKSVAVPLDAMTIEAEQEVISLDADQQRLEEAPEIDDLSFTLSTPNWDTATRTYWGLE